MAARAALPRSSSLAFGDAGSASDVVLRVLDEIEDAGVPDLR